jgi:hypothetical protein
MFKFLYQAYLSFLQVVYPEVQGQLLHFLCLIYVAVFQDEQLDTIAVSFVVGHSLLIHPVGKMYMQ